MSSSLRCEVEEEEEGKVKAQVDPAKDRSKVIPVETSIKYLQSDGKYTHTHTHTHYITLHYITLHYITL